MLMSILLLAAAPAALPDLLAEANKGKILCVLPDDASKTCAAIARYAARGKGVWQETTELLLMPGQPISLETSVLMRLDGKALCATMTPAFAARGTVRFAGTPLPPARQSDALARIAEQLAPLMGKKVCDSFLLSDGKLIRHTAFNGIPAPTLNNDRPVKWIAADAGYAVAPR